MPLFANTITQNGAQSEQRQSELEFDREAIAPLNRTRFLGGNDLQVFGCANYKRDLMARQIIVIRPSATKRATPSRAIEENLALDACILHIRGGLR